MENDKRDLLVLLKTPSLSGAAFENHVACLHRVLLQVENNETFCTAHELVKRIRITQKNKAILKAVSASELKPFYFLINKN